jgi:hypothetical protein
VASARCETPGRRDETDAAAARIERIALDFPEHAGIQHERAAAWGCVALARCQTPGRRDETDAAAARVERIALDFPEHAGLQRERAEAWRHVAFARALMPEHRDETDAAAARVERIALDFPEHAGIQFQVADAWRLAAAAWADEGDTAKARAALARCLAVCERFRGHPEWESEQFSLVYAEAQKLAARLAGGAAGAVPTWG